MTIFFLCVQQRPLNLLVANGHSARVRHRMLLLWYYEDQLKTKYAQFISILQVRELYTVSVLAFLGTKCLKIVYSNTCIILIEQCSLL